MNSARPWKMQTVPLRPGGGAKRAKRRLTPSLVFSIPATVSSGTGLAGMEMRVIARAGRGSGPYTSLGHSLNCQSGG
jgi:hypothetical protein